MNHRLRHDKHTIPRHIAAPESVSVPAAFLLCLAFLLISGNAFATRWRDVHQLIELEPDGSVIIRDDRTAVADEPFTSVSLFVPLHEGERLELLRGPGATQAGRRAGIEVDEAPGGVRLMATTAEPVNELRLRFRYRLEGVLALHEDVIAFKRILVTRRETPIQNYRLWARAPGPMAAPYEAFLHRLGFHLLPDTDMAEDRSSFRATFELLPAESGVELRYLMDPALFDVKGDTAGLDALLRDEFFISGIDELRRSNLWGLGLLALLVLLGIRVMIAYMRYRPLPEYEDPLEYNPPNYLPPATAALLTGNSPNRGMQASLLDLARRGMISLEPESDRLRVRVLDEEAPLTDFERSLIAQPAPARHPDWQAQVQNRLEAELGMPLLNPKSIKASKRYGRLALVLFGVSLVGLALTLASARFLFAVCAPLALGLALFAFRSLKSRHTDVKLLTHRWRRFARLLASRPKLKGAPDSFLTEWLELYPYAVALGVARPFLDNVQEIAAERNLTLTPPPRRDGDGSAERDPFGKFERLDLALRAVFPIKVNA